jgi:uncharacterized repeat protein (TIGR03803 family)
MSKLGSWKTVLFLCVFSEAVAIGSSAQTFGTLVSFDGKDGNNPDAGLVQGTDGNFYGTTFQGGASNYYGEIFKVTPKGTLTVLHSFEGTDGAFPYAGLTLGTDGNFYGTTSAGGANTCIIGSLNFGCGTVFKISARAALTTLVSFDGADGSDPSAGLVQATDGNFYGTTSTGGANNSCPSGCGAVFKISPLGTLKTLYSFCSQTNCDDGAHPYAELVEATNGALYGTAFSGGAFGSGTVFTLSVGLAPFVETIPTSGKVGTKVIILGNNLTGCHQSHFQRHGSYVHG